MEFGKLDDIDGIDWTIPSDDPLAVKFLHVHKRPDGMRIFFGAPAWGHAAWTGKIYPEGTRRSDYLSFYSRHFSCIELNTSHYGIPRPEKVKQWLAQVPPHFLFCPKLYQGISHARHGLLDRKLLESWLDFLRGLGPHLGPSFLQLPPYFDYAMKAELFAFLKNWPDEFPLALEFRHPSWFQGRAILPPLVEYLQNRGVGLVITDVAGRRDVLHTSISASFSLLRFIGNNLHSSDFERAAAWAKRFAEWRDQGLNELFLMIHEPDDISAPEMTDFFLERLTEYGWDIKPQPPAFPQLTLNL